MYETLNYFLVLTIPLDPARSFTILKNSNSKLSISVCSILITTFILGCFLFINLNGFSDWYWHVFFGLSLYILFTIISIGIISSILFNKVFKKPFKIKEGLFIASTSSFPLIIGQIIRTCINQNPNWKVYDSSFYFNIGLIISVLLVTKGFSIFNDLSFRKILPLAFGIFFTTKLIKMLVYAYHV